MATLINTLTLDFNKYYVMYLDIYLVSQNNASAQSVLYPVISLSAHNGGWISAGSKPWSAKIDGKSAGSGSFDPDLSTNAGKTKKATGTNVTVTHDTDGNKTVAVSCSVNFGSIVLGGSEVGTKTISGNIKLPQILRESTIDKSNTTESVTVDGVNKSYVTIIPKNTAYSHNVQWSIGSYSKEINLSSGTKSAEYAIPKEWLKAIPDAKSGTAAVKVTTLSGTTVIGTDSITFTIKCDGTEVPDFTAAVSDGTDIYSKIGCFVTKKSKLKIDLSGIQYQYGSKLSKIAITANGITYTGTAVSVTTGVIAASGKNTIKCVITDSRGYSTTKYVYCDVYDYTLPSFTTLSVSRYKLIDSEYVKDDEGDYCCIYYESKIAQIGQNSIKSILISYLSISDIIEQEEIFPEEIIATDSTGEIFVYADPEKVYKFKLKITDALDSIEYSKMLSNAETIYDILKGGKGVTFGGVATKEGFNIPFWPVSLPTKIQAGYAVITPSAADTPESVNVAFQQPFLKEPIVVATPYTSLPGTVLTGVGVRDVSVEGFDLYMTRKDTTSTTIAWVAVAVD